MEKVRGGSVRQWRCCVCEDIVRAPDEWVRWRRGRGRREGERRRERKGRRCCVCCDNMKASKEMEVAK